MCVGVDEARQDDDVAEIDGFDFPLRTPIRPVCGNVCDSSTIDDYDPVANRIGNDRKDPGSAVANQCSVRRTFFSAALRAA